MRGPKLPKILFLSLLIATSGAVIFAAGMYSSAQQNGIYRVTTRLYDQAAKDLRLVVSEAPVLMGVRPIHFLQHARYPGEGVTINRTDDDKLVLMSGFFDDGNEIRLIRRDGSIVARWPLQASQLIPHVFQKVGGPATDWNVDTHGALILPDGSVVFNFEYYGLVKLDRCGAIEWILDRPTHHSVELAEGGGFWVPGQLQAAPGDPVRYPPFRPPYDEDTIMKVSDDGEIVFEKSVVGILYDGGLAPLLTSTGHNIRRGWRDSEIVHVNKVEVLTSDRADSFPEFEAGDIALSVRGYNLVIVLDPESGAIKWWRVGPWLRQHDPEFTKRGTLLVFNNNLYRKEFQDRRDRAPVSVPRVSNIIEIDPSTDEYRIAYGGAESQAMSSIIRGKVEPTDAGGLLITEFEGGRVFETDRDGEIVWQYVNRYDEDEVAEITESRLYAQDYFGVSDWRCGPQLAVQTVGVERSVTQNPHGFAAGKAMN